MCNTILRLLALIRTDGHSTIYMKAATGSDRLVVFAARSLLNLLLGVVLSPLLVKEVKALALELLVDESSSETGEELLGMCVACGLACR